MSALAEEIRSLRKQICKQSLTTLAAWIYPSLFRFVPNNLDFYYMK